MSLKAIVMMGKFYGETVNNEKSEYSLKRTKISSFGVLPKSLHNNGFNPLMLTWIVSDRKDRRHGVVGSPKPLGKHAKYLYGEMMRKWRS